MAAVWFVCCERDVRIVMHNSIRNMYLLCLCSSCLNYLCTIPILLASHLVGKRHHVVHDGLVDPIDRGKKGRFVNERWEHHVYYAGCSSILLHRGCRSFGTNAVVQSCRRLLGLDLCNARSALAIHTHTHTHRLVVNQL